MTTGTFLSDLLFQTPSDNRPQTSFYSPNYSNKGTICLAFSPQESPEQIEMWKKVIQGFTDKYPFYKVDPDFLYNDGKGTLKDVTIFTLPCLISLADNLLDLTGFSDFSDGTAPLCPGITELCRTENGIKAMPILRFSSMLSINCKLLADTGINSGKIKEPVDLFRAGTKAEVKSSGKYGCRYLGFIYHAATYGIVLKRENTKILFDHEKVKEFLQDFQPWIRKHHFMDHGESGIQHSLNNEYVVHPDFFCCYPLFTGHPDLDIMPFPVKEGGFVCEEIHVAGISKESEKRKMHLRFSNI